jgi:hypothetical protein
MSPAPFDFAALSAVSPARLGLHFLAESRPGTDGAGHLLILADRTGGR